ncbi:MAG: class II aldolase/adducin family protein [Thermoplasmatales archaeon]|nr:MAG: class II aldolase/adducin family protein [Thermoplasmatales archaeon]
MIGNNLTTIPLQTFFVSREISKCPLISDIIKLSKKIDELGLIDNNDYCISLAYGKRILINAKNVNVESMNHQDIIEIVDYDPLKNIILAIGIKDPSIETPVHWLIHHARDDVNAIIQLNGEKVAKKLSKNLLITEKECLSGTLKLAKQVLKTLRSSKKIVIKNRGGLFVGISLKEAEELVLKTYGVYK